MPRPADAPALTIVTAANEAYWRMLHQFLASAARAGLADGAEVVAYDLGLAPASRARLQRRFPWCGFRDFDFRRWPPHVALARGTYAWKPLVIADACAQAAGLVLWLDSAGLFKRPLDEIVACIAREGTYTLSGQAPLACRAEPATLAALEAPLEILDRPERVATVIGLDPGRPAVRRLVEDWRRHALIEAHIRPESRTLKRHMHEQALLSILLYMAEARGELRLNEGEIDISSPTPIPWLSSRNRVPVWLPTWADPAARAWRAVEKTVDQRLIALERWHQRRLCGARRWPKEHFSVFLQQGADGPVVPVPAGFWSYYADPFLYRAEDTTWLFVEEFRYLENRGRLVAMALDAALRPGPPVPVLALRCHASFPYLFRHEGELYLLPETAAGRVLDLYRCERLPDRWVRVRRLFHGLDAADSVIFPHEGRWWLLTSVRPPGADAERALALYFTDDLLAGTWRAHPVNAERRYGARPFSGGRNAGPVVAHEGRLLRVMQANRRYYGDGIEVMEIARLDAHEFEERPYAGRHPFAALAAGRWPHHVSAAGDLVAWDVRDRTSYAQHLPLWPGAVRPDPRALMVAAG